MLKCVGLVIATTFALAFMGGAALAESSGHVDEQCDRYEGRIGEIVRLDMNSTEGAAFIVRSRENLTFNAMVGCSIIQRDRLEAVHATMVYRRCGEMRVLEGAPSNSEVMPQGCGPFRRRDRNQGGGATAEARTIEGFAGLRFSTDTDSAAASISFDAFASFDVNLTVRLGQQRASSLGRFCRGEADIATSTTPISGAQLDLCRRRGVQFVEAPIAYEGLAVVVNRASAVSSISLEELNRTWGAERVLMFTVQRPQRDILWPTHLVASAETIARGGAFRSVVMGSVDLRDDVIVVADDRAVIRLVESFPGAMGLVNLAVLREEQEGDQRGDVRSLAIDAGAGPIEPSFENVSFGIYPLSRPIMWYVNAGSLRVGLTSELVRHTLQNGSALALEAGQTPLPEAAYERLVIRAERGASASIFGSEAPANTTITGRILATGLREDN